MTFLGHYKQRVIEYLKSGAVPDAVWEEVADCVFAESEQCEALLIDVEMGFARRCDGCETIAWIESGEGCEVCEALELEAVK